MLSINMNTTYLWKQTKSPSHCESSSQSPRHSGKGFGGAPGSLKTIVSVDVGGDGGGGAFVGLGVVTEVGLGVGAGVTTLVGCGVGG